MEKFWKNWIRRSRINFYQAPPRIQAFVAMKTISQRSFVALDYLPVDMYLIQQTFEKL